jgi:CheY-like chemotaxis protein
MLAVTDNGAGMDSETKENAFEPFFTTKEAGKGTGLGLSTVYGIVKQSGGYVMIYSEVGRGTSLKIYLPRVDAPVDAKVPAEERIEIVHGPGSILVAEDEAAVRALLVRILEAHGYEVASAADGAEALSIASARGAPFDLLITDVMMPGGTGPELAQRLGLKTLYVSGYPGEAITLQGVLPDGVSFLQKPFSQADLARKVHRIFNET